jgi:hypothetical protein
LQQKKKKRKKKSWPWWHTPIISATAGSVKWEDHSPGQPWQTLRPYLKNTRAKMARGMAQVVEDLPIVGPCIQTPILQKKKIQ